MPHYTHAPRALVTTETTRTNILSALEKLDLYTEEGKLIPTHKIKRKYEFNGAGNLYLCDAIKYICTHEAKAIRKGGYNRFEVKLKWESFVKRAIGENTDQYHRLCNEVWRTIHEARPCYIPKEGGGWFLMQPFIVDLESVDGEKLSSEEKKRLENLNGNDGTRKLGYITIAFAKPLFQKYLEGGQYYQHPCCLYAQVHKYVEEDNAIFKDQSQNMTLPGMTKEETRSKLKLMSEEECSIFKQEQAQSPEQTEAIRSEDLEFPIISAIDWLYLHGAGDPRKTYIEIPLEDFIRHCLPSAGYEKAGTFYIRKHKEGQYLTTLIDTISRLQGFDFTITGFTGVERDGKKFAHFELAHPERLKAVLEPKHDKQTQTKTTKKLKRRP
jgi:hypothetical protein